MAQPDRHTGMQRGVYAAATAMVSSQQWLDVVSHNLANASTIGYKRDGIAFDDGLVRALNAGGGSGLEIGSLGAGAVSKGRFTDFSMGNLTPTGNPLDLAVMGQRGAFAVQTPLGVRYTRDGGFTLNSDRQVTDKAGRLVLGMDGRPITLPLGKVKVDPNGAVEVDGQVAGRIGVFDGPFRKTLDALLETEAATPMEAAQVIPQTLESSNVNAVEEMVAMIRLNRAFEMAQRSVQSQDEGTQRLIQSLQGR